jgi:hypothetical protein
MGDQGKELTVQLLFFRIAPLLRRAERSDDTMIFFISAILQDITSVTGIRAVVMDRRRKALHQDITLYVLGYQLYFYYRDRSSGGYRDAGEKMYVSGSL